MNNTNWDDKLEGKAQNDIARLVHELPEEEVNLVWRSELNEKILALQPAPKKRSWLRVWTPIAGLSAAAALALFMLRPIPPQETTTMDQSILNAHSQVVAANEMGVLGMSEDAALPITESEFEVDTEDLRPL